MSFRLTQDVKRAFGELCTATGEKPGSLLRHALAHMLGRDELYDVQVSVRKVDGRGHTVAVCWSVPADLLNAAAAQLDLPRYRTAAQAVEELLTAYGFKIKRNRL